MAFEQRNMSGSLFLNERKEKDNHPDFNGSCLIDGVEYWISGWRKEGQGGRKFTSLAFKKKEPKQAEQTKGSTQPQQTPVGDEPW